MPTVRLPCQALSPCPIPATLLLALSLLGCEEDLAPRTDLAEPFSLYGVLSPDLGVQSVRLYPLESFPTLGSPEPPDVLFTSTDLTTGTRVTWQDSVEVLPNGQYEYLYWAPFRAEFGHHYRIEAERRADGATSWAEVRIPPPVTVRVVDPNATSLEVHIEGEGFRLLTPEAAYAVIATRDGFPLLNIRIPYAGTERRTEQGWQVDVHFVRDFVPVLQQYIQETGLEDFFAFCPNLFFYGLEMNAIVADPAWDPPEGLFDADLLSHPRSLSNVENGFGFVGGGYRISPRLNPSRALVQRACYGDQRR